MANMTAENAAKPDKTIDARRYTRLNTETMVLLTLTPDRPDLFARLEDWSAAGVRLIVDAGVEIPEFIQIRKLKRHELSEPVRCQLVWRSGEQVGLKFVAPED